MAELIVALDRRYKGLYEIAGITQVTGQLFKRIGAIDGYGTSFCNGAARNCEAFGLKLSAISFQQRPYKLISRLNADR
jgi:hypothetical protein